MEKIEREMVRWAIRGARERVHEYDSREAIAKVGALGGFHSFAEAEESVAPLQPVTEASVDWFMAGEKRRAAEIRAYVAEHGAGWKPHIREQWLVEAERMEAGFISDKLRANYIEEALRDSAVAGKEHE